MATERGVRAWAGRLAWAVVLAASVGLAHARGTLTVCSEAAPDAFDIAQSETSVAEDAVGLTVYDQLLRFKPGSSELVPSLAERWEVSDDGRAYTFHLRHGVPFHATPWFKPTRTMNADDVMFSLQRMRDEHGAWRGIAPAGYLMWHSLGLADNVTAIDKLGDDSLRITLAKPSAAFLNRMAISFTGSVLSAEYAQQLRTAGRLDQLNTLPVGTGPFVFRSYQKDAVIRYGIHAGYWRGASTLDALVFAITPDANVRVQRLKAGECLVGANMRAESAPALAGTAVALPGDTALLTHYIVFNTRHKFLDDARFRRALALGFDQKGYIASVFGGRALPAGGFLPVAQWGHDASLVLRHDEGEARRLVAASGYDGRELVIFTRIGGSIDGKRAAELMQADWARIGVKTRVQMVEWAEMLKRTGLGEHDISFLGWIGYGDPDDFFTPNLGCEAVAAGGNKSLWCDKAFDALIEAARVAPERTRRIQLYAQAQRRVLDDAPLIAAAYPMLFVALNARVHGFQASPEGSLDFRGVSVDAR